MSEEFITFNFPCRECIVRATCKTIPTEKPIRDLFDQGSVRCLAMPLIDTEDMTYTKVLIECWANFGHKIICQMSKTEDPRTSMETNNQVPMQLVSMLGHLVGLAQWIVNSTSWREGTLQDFDRREINLKSKVLRL